jgi:hypothetical protein
MSCPTCDHTITGIANGVFWCPRCGSVSDFTNNITDHAVPKLVERCRWFGESQRGDSVCLTSSWAAIAESINLPANRSAT